MVGRGLVAFKLNLLFFIIFNSLVLSRAYGQSPPPPPTKKSKTQEITSVMQKSDFLKNIKLQSSTTEACDWDGDDSACPFKPPESSEFFIRTATKMSCANTAAANFLKGRKLSYLDLKITDIMDSRSRAQSALSRDRSRRNYAKFKGEERVTFSLVAWTTVESVDSGVERSSHPINPFIHNHFERGRYNDMYNKHWGRNRDDPHKGIWLQNINNNVANYLRDSFIARVESFYFSAFKMMKYSFEDTIKQIGPSSSNSFNGVPHLLEQNRWVGAHGNKAPLLQPPLAHRVHVIGYDDDVMPNAGEALLRCADEEAGVRGERKDFDPTKAFDRSVCLDYDDWRKSKVEETPSQIAKRNKRLIKAYFAKIYDPTSRDVIYRPWEGNPEKTEPYSEKPQLVYATYFAVQSCHTAVQDQTDTPVGSSAGTAYSRIKSLKEKIRTPEGHNSLRETYWRNREFEGFGGIYVWSCEPRGSANQCVCRMNYDDMKKKYYFGVKRWNPQQSVTLSENHGGDHSDLNKVKCFRALEKSFSDRGAEYYNCGYYMGSGGREGAVLSDENQHYREKIREYCKHPRSPLSTGVWRSDEI